MKSYPISRQIWRVIYPLLIWLGLTFLAAGVGAVVVGLVVTIRDGLEDYMIEAAIETFLNEHGLWLLIVGNALSAAVLIPMWLQTRKSLPVFENAKLGVSVITLTAFFFIFFNFILSSLFSFIDILRFFSSYEELIEALAAGSFLVQILAVGIVAPVVEEVLYRGIILNRLLQWIPKWVAVLISSALFGLMHFNLFQGLYAFATGIVVAVVYLRYRNLWIPIIGHVVFNMTSVVVGEIFERTGAEFNALLFLIPGVLLSIVSIVLMVKFTKPAVLIQNPNTEVDATPFIQPEGQH